MPCIHMKPGILTFVGNYQPGDQPPTGYLDWHHWADVQHKAGLRQRKCGRCGTCKYPQELSHLWDESKAMGRTGNVVALRSPVCNGCAATAQAGR